MYLFIWDIVISCFVQTNVHKSNCTFPLRHPQGSSIVDSVIYKADPDHATIKLRFIGKLQ